MAVTGFMLACLIFFQKYQAFIVSLASTLVHKSLGYQTVSVYIVHINLVQKC